MSFSLKSILAITTLQLPAAVSRFVDLPVLAPCQTTLPTEQIVMKMPKTHWHAHTWSASSMPISPVDKMHASLEWLIPGKAPSES